MIVYDGIKSEFLNSVMNGTIAEEVRQRIFEKMGRTTPKSEFDSWKNSLSRMYMVLADTSIPDHAGIAIEYNVPQTSKRVDFIVSGYDADNQSNAVIIELKQWDELKKVDGKDALVETYTGGGLREVVHPCYQVWSYATLIRDYNKTVQDQNIVLSPCAYLHNYALKENDPILDEQYKEYIEEAPVFCERDALKLREFIHRFIQKGDDKKILYEIDHGKIRPSKSLQNAISNMLKGNREFIMIDDQKVVYENILQLACKSQKDGKKRTIIVEGGPGTGKSVIAVQLLVGLTKKNQFVQYVSKNQAPRNVYKAKLKGTVKLSSVDNMFRGSASYVHVGKDQINTLIVDEAHRLEERSQYTKKTGNENQIKEIINASKCSVFFIDESQRVTMSDIGSVDEIKKWAKVESSEITQLKLLSQFRCNGSDGYLAWVDNTLEIQPTANYNLEDIDYDIRVLDSPLEVRELIIEKNKINHRSRMLAGYCWDWIRDGKNNSKVHDIKIGDFEMSWNLGNSIFALDETSIDEIGCIHTSQGLEFDYVGLIIGDDMRYEDHHIVTDASKRAKTDQSMKGIKKLDKQDHCKAEEKADEIIKNTYRTLMTRGMKGCYIYCTDQNLRNYLKQKIQRQ
ncbi:DUF2075 domain-containing protein [Erysipelotrichaceae bacterium 7770_A6]|nr:DUF2075 domain-containing protein [Erysipelotrichaceae bacterium 7770_A6]